MNGIGTTQRRSLLEVGAKKLLHHYWEKSWEFWWRRWSLQDMYNSIDKVHVVCFLVNSKDMSFEEIRTIKHNNK